MERVVVRVEGDGSEARRRSRGVLRRLGDRRDTGRAIWQAQCEQLVVGGGRREIAKVEMARRCAGRLGQRAQEGRLTTRLTHVCGDV